MAELLLLTNASSYVIDGDCFYLPYSTTWHCFDRRSFIISVILDGQLGFDAFMAHGPFQSRKSQKYSLLSLLSCCFIEAAN